MPIVAFQGALLEAWGWGSVLPNKPSSGNHATETVGSTLRFLREHWLICYTDCPIIWTSNLQPHVDLSTTEAQCIFFFMSLQDVLPAMFCVLSPPFQEHVRSRKIKIFPIETKEQSADTLAKALPHNTFFQHQQSMCGQ